jgi:ankyrin repeat protein
MLLCSYVVESSTDEKRYQATNDWNTRIVWLQQTKTVSDQVFESCMVYAKDDRQIITTSRRMKRRNDANPTDKNEDAHSAGYNDPSAFLQLVTISGTAVALCGFVLQFVGLRGMHWSASVAQLGAVIVMVTVKAWVRRGLARSPAFEPLPSGFELDSFVKTLGKIDREGWSGAQSNKDDLNDNKSKSDTPPTSKDWTVVTGGKSSLVSTGEARSGDPSLRDGRIFDAQSVLDTRKQLARLANWRGHASSEAVSLARAIECTMDNLYKKCSAMSASSPEGFVWALETHYMGTRVQEVNIKLRPGIRGWNVDATEIEAILSLWLSSVDENRNPKQGGLFWSDFNDRAVPTAPDDKQCLLVVGKHTPSLARDLQWWIPRDLLRLDQVQANEVGSIGVSHHRIEFSRHDEKIGEDPLSWYIYFDTTNNGFEDLLELWPEGDSDSDTEDSNTDDSDVERSAAEKFVSDPDDPDSGSAYDHGLCLSSEDEADEAIDETNESDEENPTGPKLLCSEAWQQLRSLYAMELYSSFMRAAAKAMLKKIPGEAEKIQTSDHADGMSWRVFSLRNSHLSEMIQDVHNTGLGSLDQIYLSILTPLSVEDKLPGVSAVVNLALHQAKQNEQSRRWQQAGEDLIWLSRLANTTFKPQSPVVEEAAANLIEYLRLIDRILEWKTPCDSDSFSSFGISTYDLQKLHSKLQKELRNFDMSLRKPIETKAEMISLMQAKSLLAKKHGIYMDPRDVLHRTAAHYAAFTDDEFLVGETLQTKHQIDTQDLSGRTAMHFACLGNSCKSLGIVHLLLSHGADLNIRARDGATPLHYAAMTGKQDVVEALVEAGATIDFADLSGGSSLHTAAVYGHVPVVQYLWGKVGRDLRGQSGWTVLQLVAVRGKEEVAQFLVEVEADQKAKDRSGRTALHLAVEGENLSVLKVLLKGRPDLEAEDSSGMTALYQAVDSGQNKMVECLIKAGANTNAEGYMERPIELAVRRGYEAIVHLLLTDGYDCHWKNRHGDNLLHMASSTRNTNLVKEFLERGLGVNSKGFCDLSPLHYAASWGILSNGRLLLNEGANTEQVDAKGWTPLWYAAKNGDAKFVQVLLYRGASVGKNPDIHDKTVLDLAEASSDKKVLHLLQRHLQQHRTAVASPIDSSTGASSNTDSRAGPSLSSGGLSTGDGV